MIKFVEKQKIVARAKDVILLPIKERKQLKQ